MKKEIKIDKLKLTIGDHKVELTVEEARELQHVLGELLGKDKEYITIPQAPIEPYNPNPTYPQVVPYWQTGDPLDHQIYCSRSLKVEY